VETNGKQYHAVPGMIPGTRMNLGGEWYVLPPLNLRQCEELEENIKKLGTVATDGSNFKEQFSVALPLIHASFMRNYPDATIEQLREIIDFGNFAQAAEAIVKSSGYEPAKPGE
jgi:hypothetical protein